MIRPAQLLLAGILVLAGPIPVNAQSQKVALPNGEVLHFNGKGGSIPEHSTDVMNKWGGPVSVAWRILMGRPIVWDAGDKETVAKWIGSPNGQVTIRAWMTKGDSHGTVFNHADVVLRNYFPSR